MNNKIIMIVNKDATPNTKTYEVYIYYIKFYIICASTVYTRMCCPTHIKRIANLHT